MYYFALLVMFALSTISAVLSQAPYSLFGLALAIICILVITLELSND